MDNKQSQSLTIPETFKIGDTELNMAALVAKKEEDTKLMIAGVDDTTGYKKAIALRGGYRTTRTTLEKLRKDLSKPHQDYVKSLKKTTDELGAVAEQAEIYFDDMIKTVDHEKARIKAEKEAEQQRIVQERIAKLYALGARFDGENYIIDYEPSFFMSTDEIKSLTTAKFDLVVIFLQESYDKEQKRLEKERLDREQAEAELEAAKAKLATERKKLRILQLTMLHDFKYNDTLLRYELLGYGHIGERALIEYNDEQWDAIIKQVEFHSANYDGFKLKPEPQPTFKQYNNHTYDGKGIDTFASVNNVSLELPETVITVRPQASVDVSEELGRVETAITFYKDKPYHDIAINPKTTLRIYPYEYNEQAVPEITNVVKSGSIQDKLYYTVLKK